MKLFTITFLLCIELATAQNPQQVADSFIKSVKRRDFYTITDKDRNSNLFIDYHYLKTTDSTFFIRVIQPNPDSSKMKWFFYSNNQLLRVRYEVRRTNVGTGGIIEYYFSQDRETEIVLKGDPMYPKEIARQESIYYLQKSRNRLLK
jgi:hypothetical protein